MFQTEHMRDAKVMIAAGIRLGKSKHGWRSIVPITGGTFELISKPQPTARMTTSTTRSSWEP
jgi:hypothetical protein